MNTYHKVTSLLLSLLFPFLAIANGPEIIPGHDHSAEPQNLTFIQNQRQWDPAIRFLAPMNNGEISLRNAGFTFSFLEGEGVERVHETFHDPKWKGVPPKELLGVNGHVYEVNFVGANANPVLDGSDKAVPYFNFFMGKDQSKWAGGVPAFGRIKYSEVYTGIDLHAYSVNGQFKTDWHISKGADPSQIVMEYNGLGEISLKDGNLVLETSIGEFQELHPVAFQIIGCMEQDVPCEFVLKGNRVSFTFPAGYDNRLPLWIDPVLIGATYSGTTSSVYGHTATYDVAGNIYAAGGGFSPGGLPITPGAFQSVYGGSRDYAIVKFVPDASALIYATYLGGSGSDLPHSMVVNSSNELITLGSTSSSDYPTTPGAFQPTLGGGDDIAITRFNAAGTGIIASTYIGGTSVDGVNDIYANYGDRYRGEIIVDPLSNIYVADMSSSSNFPVTSGAFQSTLSGGQDAVAFKLTPDLSTLLFSTYIGSPSDDAGFGIEPDITGGAFISGSIGTGSTLPTAGGAFPSFLGGSHDGFILHLNTTGASVGNATYFGSTGMDQNFFIELDRSDRVLVFGQSDGNVTATPGAYSGPSTGMYIARFSPDLSAHQFTATSGDLAPTAFLVDNCGYIYIAGHGASGGTSNYEVSPNALNGTGAGFYLMVLEPNAVALNYGTFYGAPGSHVDGGTSRFDPRGVVYEATCTSGGFPTTPTAYSTNSTAGWDICPFKIDFETHPMVAQAAASPTVFGCAPHTVNFINNSTAQQYFWNFMDGSPIDTTYSPTHTFTSPGLYGVMLIAVDTNACITRDTIILPIFVGSATATAAFTDSVDCATQSVIVNDLHVGGTGVTWLMGDGTTLTGAGNFTHNYASPGTYTITQIVANAVCGNSDTTAQTITILPAVTAGLTAGPALTGCTPLDVNFNSTSTNFTNLTWSFGDGTTSTLASPSHTYPTGGTYVVTLIATNPTTCNLADTATTTIVANQTLDVTALFQDVYDCATRSITLTNQSTQASGVVYQWSFGDGGTSSLYNVTHPYTNPGTYPVQLIVWDTVCGDRDTMAVTIDADYLPAIDLGPRQALCEGEQTTLDPGIAGFNYYWSTGDTTQTITVDSGGTYYIIVWNGSCQERDQVIVDQSIPLEPGYTTEICVGVPVKLDAGQASQYSWDAGGSGRYITVNRGGDYPVMLTDRFGCIYSDTIRVIENGIGTGPFIPNAFTPNDDGVNDVFQIGAYNGSFYDLYLYDRWGKLIYHSLSVNDSWDGKIEQIDAPEGVYVYKLFYENPCQTDKRELLAGSVTLYR